MWILFLPPLLAAPPPPIVGGEITDEWPAVAMLWVEGTCSGTLIAPRWILTAAHCVSGLADPGRGTAYFGGDVLGGEIIAQSSFAATYVYDGADYNAQFGWDIALIELSGEITGIEPLPVFGGDASLVWSGGEVTYVGFGISGSGQNDAGIKRVVEGVDTYMLDYTYFYTFEPGTNVCSGDSGGAMILPTDDGPVLLGANSFVWSTDANMNACDEGGGAASRAEHALAWIQDLVPEVVVYTVEPEEPEEPEDTGADTGTLDDTAVDTADTAVDTADTAPIAQEDEETIKARGCSSAGLGGGLLWAMLLVGRRRR